MKSDTQKLDPHEFQKYVREHQSEFTSQVHYNGINYSLTYLPEELKIIYYYQTEKISIEEAEVLLKNCKNEITLLFQIEIKENAEKEFLRFRPDSLTYEERIKYYSFEFKNDILIKDQNMNSIQLQGYHFERNFGISPKGTFSLSIKRDVSLNHLHIQFQDKIFGKEVLQIKLLLPTLPKLKHIKKWKNK